MDVIIIFNGLGNQMSQYAFYLNKKSINKSTYFIPFCEDHNGLELNKVFNIKIRETYLQTLLYVLFRILLTDKIQFIAKPVQRLLRFLKCSIIKENFNYNFNKEYLTPSKGITYYYGGWHSEKYFCNSKNEILKKFKFIIPLNSENITHLNNIYTTNSVSIHVRRGDYLNYKNFNLFGDVCNKAYYEKTIEYMYSIIKQPHFFVFSNDMEWVKSNLQINNVTYVTCNSGFNSWIDMYLMSNCKHNIVSNSTFSWWGAWLNTNNDKIVISSNLFFKTKEFTDIYPKSWIKISDY